MIHALSGTPEDVSLSIALPTPPSVNVVPSDASPFLNLGTNLTLTANVFAGTPSFQYQWKRNGVALANGTSAVYQISNAGVADSGTYEVVVTNFKGVSSASQAVSFMNLNLPLTITGPGRKPRHVRGHARVARRSQYRTQRIGKHPLPRLRRHSGSLAYSGTTASPLNVNTALNAATRTLYQNSATSALAFGSGSSFAISASGGTLVTAAAAPSPSEDPSAARVL
jgi:hypothetical protein